MGEPVKLSAIHKEHDGQHLLLPCKTLTPDGPSKATAFIDCDETGIAYIARNMVRQHKLPLNLLATPKRLELADGIFATLLTHLAILDLVFGGHVEQITAYVVDSLGTYDFILGIKRLDTHDPTVRWTDRTLTFGSAYCLHKCLMYQVPVTIKQKGFKPSRPQADQSRRRR